MTDDIREDRRKAPYDLTAAIRRARVEEADRSQVVAELRGAELARLEMLQEAVAPVLEQVPQGIDMFDTGIAPGERPRLFLDILAFVEMGHDRRTYRFLQDTRHGRLTVCETDKIDVVVEAIIAYVARRLVEREQALASDQTVEQAARKYATVKSAEAEAAPAAAATPPATRTAFRRQALASATETRTAAEVTPQRPATWKNRFANGLLFVVEVLGSIALFAILIGASYFLYKLGEAWWVSHFGA